MEHRGPERPADRRAPAGDPLERLDHLTGAVVAGSGLRFDVVPGPAAEAAFRVRFAVVVAAGWVPASQLPGGMEHDADDDRAMHVIAWRADRPVATTRIVLPGARPLPTERELGRTVPPAGAVVDVGRIAVVPDARERGGRVLSALLARTYLAMRELGYSTACGMMAPRVRTLLRVLGVEVEVLGPDREHWHEMRAPVLARATEISVSAADRWQAITAG